MFPEKVMLSFFFDILGIIADILSNLSNQGEFAQNPVLSGLPTKKEIMAEIDQILMSM